MRINHLTRFLGVQGRRDYFRFCSAFDLAFAMKEIKCTKTILTTAVMR